MHHKNNMNENRSVVENAKAAALRERDQLRQSLTDELAKSNINVDEIAQSIVAERLAEANTKFQQERDELQGFL